MPNVPDAPRDVTLRPDGFPEAFRPILGRWPFMDWKGRRAFWRCVMTREAWDALPPEVQFDAVLSEDGRMVICDVPDPEGPGMGPAPTPRPRPDLAGVVVQGRICGDPVIGFFVTAADWAEMPAERRPPALRERNREWYLVFDRLPADSPTTLDAD